MKTVTFQISGMHCTSCAMMIDGDLEDTEGVKESSTNYAKAQTQVTFNPAKINVEKITHIIQKAGYTAEVIEEK